MKKILLLIAASAALTASAEEAQVIFKETFGTPSSEKNEPIAEHVWDNPIESYAWVVGINVDETTQAESEALNVRSNNPSKGYDDASGDGNLYFNNNNENSFSIMHINTADTDNNTLSFGIFGKGDDEFHYVNSEMETKLAFRIKYYDLDNPYIPEGPEDEEDGGVRIDDKIDAIISVAKTWYHIEAIELPKLANMEIRFYCKKKCEVRLDDIVIAGTNASGVETVVAAANDGAIYDITGRRLQAEPNHGFYIKGGKKFVK